MAILDNRVKIRNNLFELTKFTVFSVKKFLILILILASCYLLYFYPPRLLANGLLEMSGRVLSMGALISKESIQTSKWIYSRLSYFKNLEAENLKLKLEIAELKNSKQIASQSQAENLELRKILNVAKKIENNFITAKIVGMAISPFTNSATIQAGTNDGISVNNIVRGKSGLIGRISEVSNNYSKVMLITDHNSRIPIITANSKARGILAKQGERLKMIYLQEGHNVTNGEIIYTSGDGKIYPKGIAVAIVEQITNEGVFVRMIENLDDLEFAIIES